jgi:hypothetical protein
MQQKNTPRRGSREARPRPRRKETIRSRAERITRATGAYSPELREHVTALLDKPDELRPVVERIEAIERDAEPMRAGAHELGHKAYTAALRFYYDHHDQPEALARFVAQLEGSARR